MEEEIYKKNLEEMIEKVDKIEREKEEKIREEAIEEFKKEEKISEEAEKIREEIREKIDNFVPKTALGKKVKAGKIKDIKDIFAEGLKIMEPEIVDFLIPNLTVDILFIGQAKGKFGGGKRRAFRQTQKKTEESNVITFGVMAVVGDRNGHVGIGYGRASETLPAREKAIRKAKLNLIEIKRGCRSFDCSCNDPHSIPFKVSGKCSSVRLTLIPAPQGTGLVIGDEMKKILKAAGIKDIYSQKKGKVRTTINTAKALIDALNKLNKIKE